MEKNKILIALVLVVGLSGNVLASDKLYYICNDEESNEIETWVIDKSRRSASRTYVRETGQTQETKFILTIGDFSIAIGRDVDFLNSQGRIRQKWQFFYRLDRKTLKLREINKDINSTVNPSFCKPSSRDDTNEFLDKKITARKLKYEESIKF